MDENRNSINCPGCDSLDVQAIGDIAPSCDFAGRRLEHELEGGRLCRCHSCQLWFRYPRQSAAELNKLYRSGSEKNWSSPVAQRTDWRLIRQCLASQKGIKRVLDIGCFDGRLLEYLGKDYHRLGIEIHDEAAQRARGRGVQIVGRDFDNLPALHPPADAVMAVDVIEHCLDPRAMLRGMASCVRPGGYIVVASGNTETPTWRLMGSRYWYCHIAEHISFISPSWVKNVAAELGLDILHVRRFSHAQDHVQVKQKIYETSANLLLRIAPRLFAMSRKCGLGKIDLRQFPGLALAPPCWMTAKDHILVVLRR